MQCNAMWRNNIFHLKVSGSYQTISKVDLQTQTDIRLVPTYHPPLSLSTSNQQSWFRLRDGKKNVLLEMRSKLQACPVFGMLFWCLVVDSVSGVVHNWVHSSVSLSAVIRSVSEGPELLQAAHQFHSISAVRQTRRGPRGKDSKDKVGLCQWHGVIVMS